jgi:hypothetical protein
MNLTNKDIDIFDSILKTLIYNNISDLKEKLLISKTQLTKEKYNLLIYGNNDLYNKDCDLEDKDMYRIIKELDNRWCLKSILYYHLKRIKRISQTEYNEVLNI